MSRIERITSILLLLFVQFSLRSGCQAEEPAGLFGRYWELVKNQDRKGLQEYVVGLSKEQLILACKQATVRLPAEFKDYDESRNDAPRSAAIGWHLAPFVQQYARLSLKSGQKIDPTPFHRMMLGKSVDVGVRGILVEMLGDSDFYEPSWKFFQQDLKTYGQIMANAELGIEIRLAAASNISSFTGGLYLRLYHKCPALKKHPLNTNLRKRKCPDVALMLKEDPGQFTEEERARLKALMAAADLVVGKSLAILKSHGSRRARVLVYNITRGPYRMNLLRSPDLVAKAKALVEGL